jgi:ATP-dependent Lon protease
LLDRMEIISLGGYTELEKVRIAQQHLIPKCAKNNGLEKVNIKFDDNALEELIRFYTREAGVRNLEREISSVCRKIAKALLQQLTEKTPVAVAAIPEVAKTTKETKVRSPKVETAPVVEATEETPRAIPLISLDNMTTPMVDASLINMHLGPRRYSIGETATRDEVGVVQGLAYTEVGGDLLITEVAVVTGKGNLRITGKLGEVMQESAQAAFSYVRSRAAFLGLEEDFYSKVDIHVHFPEGAIPKDGPSAGVTMATALVSALTRRPVSRDIAMTGEITLRGRVLGIGGLKEKLLAAHRGGVKKVIIPKENEKDLHEIPKKIQEELKIVFADHMDQVLVHAIAWVENDDLLTRLTNSELYTVVAAPPAAAAVSH